MKIDTHQHYWRYRAEEFPWISAAMPALQRDCMPVDCEAAMRAAGVDAVVAVQARTLAAETDFLLRVADHNPEVIGVVGWADLAAPDLEQRLEQWGAHAAFKGLRHILQDEPDVGAWVAHAGHNAGLRALQQRGLVYDVLVFDHQLPGVAEFCARHDRHWLVLDHLGKPAVRDWSRNAEVSQRWSRCIRELATMPHVVCKLSGVVTETDWSHQQGLSPEEAKIILACFDQALEAFGPQRLMYGSDWPVCQLAAPYEGVHGLAHKWAKSRLTVQEQDAFWSGNAIRCYGLNVQALTD
ncbi:amidohydrolase family protein [uncultured Rhodoferax sp.]|uniref:amidohydrolase family protein n=1 Tax=uncultured Rhodoferax sp. TaxID=223188 RepID=UPI0025FE9A34|nr:amidohydrolase family protein [uncultured Rhodoferax sp.]